MRLEGVPADLVESYPLDWQLGKCAETGLFTVSGLLRDIKDRTRQCWIVVDDSIYAMLLTQIADDELKSCRLTHWAGRDVRKWHHLIRDLEAWARQIGCRRFEIHAPMNGKAMAERHGYRPSHIIMEKDLGR